MRIALATIGLMVMPAVAMAEDLETTHLFGFTLGTDVNNVGEVEGELETVGRFGKSDGTYKVLSPTLGLKFIPFQNFSIEPGIGVDYYKISSVPGLEDRQQLGLDRLSVEFRYRLLDRGQAPIGLTLGVDPHWGHIDDISGDPVRQYGVDFLVAVDRELIANRLFAAFNLIYQPETQRQQITGAWQSQSDFGISGALTLQVRPGILVGAEARYLRSFDSLGFDAPAGQAFFIGPTFYAKFNERIWMSAAWSLQVAGRASSEPGSLDLTNFERRQAVLRFGYNF
ncbi:hypothetical protein [Bradyrhizobium sp. dw_411]|uniref:hypothetical protein n=1 Tax=Bradyrhizobium sp. dw_411 TaxID=2720082 RepID=UPI001BD09AC3|nr:hypothetical protein [Bradyrhizobium sp. dw_411]